VTTVIVVIVLAAGAWRVIDLALRPWKKCWACKGTGKSRWSGERFYDDCRWCDGGKKPRELRRGARLVRPGLARKGRRSG
jgi:hypothetical protein